MRILNRLLGFLLLLVMLVAALATVGLVLGVVTVGDVARVWPYPPNMLIAWDIAHVPDAARLWIMGGAIAVVLLSLLGLIGELTPPPRRARLLVLQGAGPGHTEIAYAALDALAVYGARDVAGIERVRARVNPTKGGLAVRGRALVSPYVELATAGPQLEQAIALRLERATGLPVHTVRLRADVQHTRAPRTVR